MRARARRAIATLCAVAMAAGPAWASPDDGGPSEGDAPDVVAAQAPEVQARVAVVVVGQDGDAVPFATRATLQVSLERALGADARLQVVDADTALAQRAGQVPTDTISEARGLLGAGEELLRRGRVEPALQKLEAASAHLAEVLAWTPKAELARAQFLLGAAHAMRGDDKAAIATFVALLAWRPDYAADPEIAPKAVLPAWEKAAAKVARLPGGSIEIGSTPDGAMAYVDGRFVGFTPTVVEGLPAAVHYVTVRMHGRGRAVSAVKVTDRKPAQVTATLDPSPGGDELDAAIGEASGGLGTDPVPAAVQGALGDVGALLSVQQVVVLVVPRDPAAGALAGHVYDVERGRLAASAQTTLGERDPEEALGELARALYATVSFEPPPPPPPPARVARGTPVWRHWWFWGSMGAAVVAGIALPLWLGRDTTPPLTCPVGQSCGLIVLSF